MINACLPQDNEQSEGPTIPFRENSSAVCPFIATDKPLKNISSDSWTFARVLSAKGLSKFWFILWILIFIISCFVKHALHRYLHNFRSTKNVFCLLLSLKNETNCLNLWWMPSYINFNLVLFNNIIHDGSKFAEFAIEPTFLLDLPFLHRLVTTLFQMVLHNLNKTYAIRPLFFR